jgi:hypothetical protein
VNVQHNPHGVFLFFVEDGHQYVYDKFHRSVIVVKENYPVFLGFLYFCPLFFTQLRTISGHLVSIYQHSRKKAKPQGRPGGVLKQTFE